MQSRALKSECCLLILLMLRCFFKIPPSIVDAKTFVLDAVTPKGKINFLTRHGLREKVARNAELKYTEIQLFIYKANKQSKVVVINLAFQIFVCILQKT